MTKIKHQNELFYSTSIYCSIVYVNLWSNYNFFKRFWSPSVEETPGIPSALSSFSEWPLPHLLINTDFCRLEFSMFLFVLVFKLLRAPKTNMQKATTIAEQRLKTAIASKMDRDESAPSPSKTSKWKARHKRSAAAVRTQRRHSKFQARFLN